MTYPLDNMISNNTYHLLVRALQNKEVIAFLIRVLKKTYSELFKHRAEATSLMIDTAFAKLTLLRAEEISSATFSDYSIAISRDIFHTDDPDFWFHKKYRYYKTNIRAKNDYQFMKDYIIGKEILDFGSGTGHLSLQLWHHGFHVTCTDIIDCRYNEAKSLPFVEMQSPTDLKFKENAFDTTIVQLVLHHIDEIDLYEVLRRLQYCSRHVIIEEDTYDPQIEDRISPMYLHDQALFQEFLSLSKTSQLHYLVLIDYFANFVVAGVSEMNLPFQFRTAKQWQTLLNSNGFTIRQNILTGFEPYRLHQTCTLWMICDKSTII